MKRGTSVLTDAEAAAYAAPFPDVTFKAGVRRFPDLVMVSPEMEGVDTAKRAAKYWSEDWSGDSFMAVGAADPVLGVGQMQALRKTIRNCPEPMIVEDGVVTALNVEEPGKFEKSSAETMMALL